MSRGRLIRGPLSLFAGGGFVRWRSPDRSGRGLRSGDLARRNWRVRL